MYVIFYVMMIFNSTASARAMHCWFSYILFWVPKLWGFIDIIHGIKWKFWNISYFIRIYQNAFHIFYKYKFNKIHGFYLILLGFQVSNIWPFLFNSFSIVLVISSSQSFVKTYSYYFMESIHHSMHAHLNSFRHLVKRLTNGMYSIFITFNFVLYLYENLTKSLHRFNGKTIQRVWVSGQFIL